MAGLTREQLTFRMHALTKNLLTTWRRHIDESKAPFKTEYKAALVADTPNVSPLRLEIKVHIEQASKRAMMAEHGFGGSGAMDKSPDYGKEGAYQMNALLLQGKHVKQGTKGPYVDVMFPVKGALAQQRIESILTEDSAKDTSDRKRRVEELRTRIFGNPTKDGPGVLNPVSSTIKAIDSDGHATFTAHQAAKQIAGSVTRLEKGTITAAALKSVVPRSPKHVTDLFHGMMRVEASYSQKQGQPARVEGNGFVIFRRVSEKSAPWVHKGIKGAHLVDKLNSFSDVRAIYDEMKELGARWKAEAAGVA